jgi:cytochrome c-type biogenesis protein CcmH
MYEGQARPWRLAVAITAAALLGAAGLYIAIGSPGVPGRPFATTATSNQDRNEAIEAAFARVEAYLQQHPEDGRGWEVIAPVYMHLGRYDEAAKARSNALRLLGATAEREADLGEALVASANGVVTVQAKTAFDKAIRLDPANVSARFYQGLAAEQDGSPAEAARRWRALLADAPQDAPWAVPVRRALSRVDPTAVTETRSATDAAQDVTAEQDQMIRGMVERLAARLRQDGSDVEAWVRLVRSYRVLNDAERERAAVADAQRALANDAAKLRRLEEGLKAMAAEIAAAPSSPAVAADAPLGTASNHDSKSMVERLAARLKREGSDVDGWIMLVRSYQGLGEPDRASAAAADARRALANDPDRLHQLDDAMKRLGVERSER